MPYINKADRDGQEPICGSPGKLNFYITEIILRYLGPDPHYNDFNEVIGVLESVKLELYRRAIAPYEDQKMEENGDVY